MPPLLDLPALKEAYDRDGFVIIRQYLSVRDVSLLGEHADAVMKDFQYLSSFKGVRKDLNRADNWFKESLESGSHLSLIAALILDKPTAASAAFFDKPIGESGEISQHVDGLGKQDGATIWIALDRADNMNGCLCYVKGSHNKEHSSASLAGFNEESEGAVCIEAQPGDAIIHSARTVHWSRKSSCSDRRRRAVSYFYWSTTTLGGDWPDKQQPKEQQASGAIPKDFDIFKGEAALRALDRDWAKQPAVVQMFRKDPVKFLNGLKLKDEEAFNFIVGAVSSGSNASEIHVGRRDLLTLCAGICVGIIAMRFARRIL